MNEVPEKKKKRRKKNYVLRLVIIIAILAGAGVVMHLDYFDVNGVAVTGNEEISDEEILQMADVEIGKSVFDVHPFIVQHRIKQNLYISDVNVDRVLPNKVEIHVEEITDTAQFIKGKKYIVTDLEGKVIELSPEERKATLVENVTVAFAEKKKKIKVKEEKTYEKAMELISKADENDLFFKKIVIDGNNVDAYVYDELKCSGKYANMVESMESDTLRSVIYDLYQKGTEKGTINIYRNDYCFFTPQE